MSSFSNSKDELVQKFVEVTTNIKTLHDRLEQLSDMYKNIESDINFKRQAQDAFKEAEQIFKEQMILQESYRKDAQPHEVNDCLKYNRLLKNRLVALEDCKRNLETDLNLQRRRYQKLEMDINKSKIEINTLLYEEKLLKSTMTSRNIPENLIKCIAEEGTDPWINQDIIRVKYDERNWFFEDYDREIAFQKLNDSPTGTFLIRKSTLGAYALSIAVNGTVNHCVIYKTDKGNYGFAEPYNIYKSLKELVLHYSTNSLEEHNESLQTTLLYPLNFYAEDNWFVENCSREESARKLSDAPTGTFLIRKSRIGAYALSITANGTVNHCAINKTDKGNYGFAEPYNTFRSLKELVLYYSTNSLKDCNKNLQTPLLFPLNIYLQTRERSNSTGSNFSIKLN